MVKSFFLDYINHFQGMVTAIVKKYNGTNEQEETFLYQTHLEKKLSIDGRWTSLTGMFNCGLCRNRFASNFKISWF